MALDDIYNVAALDLSAVFDTLDHATLINNLDTLLESLMLRCNGLSRMCMNARNL